MDKVQSRIKEERRRDLFFHTIWRSHHRILQFFENAQRVEKQTQKRFDHASRFYELASEFSDENKRVVGNSVVFLKNPTSFAMFFFKKKLHGQITKLFKKFQGVHWNHDTNTLHHSETNGVAERAVRRGCSYLRNVYGQMADGKKACEKKYHNDSDGPSISLGTLIEYIPITTKASKDTSA